MTCLIRVSLAGIVSVLAAGCARDNPEFAEARASGTGGANDTGTNGRTGSDSGDDSADTSITGSASGGGSSGGEPDDTDDGDKPKSDVDRRPPIDDPADCDDAVTAFELPTAFDTFVVARQAPNCGATPSPCSVVNYGTTPEHAIYDGGDEGDFFAFMVMRFDLNAVPLSTITDIELDLHLGNVSPDKLGDAEPELVVFGVEDGEWSEGIHNEELAAPGEASWDSAAQPIPWLGSGTFPDALGEQELGVADVTDLKRGATATVVFDSPGDAASYVMPDDTVNIAVTAAGAPVELLTSDIEDGVWAPRLIFYGCP